MQLTKYAGNPIISPHKEHPWEALVTTNPGVWFDEDSGLFTMVYRAAGNDEEHKINLAWATSLDGFLFAHHSEQPLFTNCDGSWDGGSMEDPRIIKFGEFFFLTYAAVPYPPGRYWELENAVRKRPDVPPEAPYVLRNNLTRTGLAITRDFKTIYRAGPISDQTLDDRDVMIFPEKVGGKFVTLHRPMQWVGDAYHTKHPAIWIAFSDDLLEHKTPTLLAQARFDWEEKVGGAAPPIKTEHGWFMLYHAVGADKKYRVGMMMLDAENPTIVTHRCNHPILEPGCDYEKDGIYKGICFPCGNAVKDGTLFVYYGGADQYVGVATANFREMVDYLLQSPEPQG